MFPARFRTCLCVLGTVLLSIGAATAADHIAQLNSNVPTSAYTINQYTRTITINTGSLYTFLFDAHDTVTIEPTDIDAIVTDPDGAGNVVIGIVRAQNVKEIDLRFNTNYSELTTSNIYGNLGGPYGISVDALSGNIWVGGNVGTGIWTDSSSAALSVDGNLNGPISIGNNITGAITIGGQLASSISAGWLANLTVNGTGTRCGTCCRIERPSIL